MANFKLPANWYTPRTEENYQAVNTWLNEKWNTVNGYEKPGGFITNHTQRGTQAPYKNSPKGYTLISHEDFMQHVVGKALVKTIAPALPEYWIVKADKSLDFEKVLKFINETAGTNYKGKDQSYYGFDGAFKSRFEAEEFLNKPVVLTAQEFVARLENAPAKKAAGYKPAPQLAELENLLEQEAINEAIDEEQILPIRKGAAMNLNAPLQAPPVQGFAGRAQYTVGHILTKRYPGSVAIGANTRLNMGVNIKSELYQDLEYFQPVKEDLPVVGEFVKFLLGYAQIPKDSILKVERVELVGNLPVITINYIGQTLRLSARYTQVTQEIPMAVIGNFRCLVRDQIIEVARGQENGKTEFTKADLRIIRQLNSRVFKVQIGEVAAVLTNAEIDRMLML